MSSLLVLACQSWLAISYNFFLENKIYIWLVYLIGWGTNPLSEPKFANDCSYPQWCEITFHETTKKQCFHVDLSMQRYISVFIGDQKYGKMKTIFAKSVLAFNFISAQFGKFTSHHTYWHMRGGGGGLNMWAHGNNALWTTKRNHNLYEDFKGYSEVALHNISKWGCNQGWMSLV